VSVKQTTAKKIKKQPETERLQLCQTDRPQRASKRVLILMGNKRFVTLSKQGTTTNTLGTAYFCQTGA
jgi:hypothetical protein